MAETPSSPVPEPSTGGAEPPSAPTGNAEVSSSPEAASPVLAPPATAGGAQVVAEESVEASPLPPALGAPASPEALSNPESAASIVPPAAPPIPAVEPAPAAPPGSPAPSVPVAVVSPVAPPAENVVAVEATMEAVTLAVEAEAAGDAGEPRVATTLDVPPLSGGGASLGSEGGEWELLVGKVQAWLEQADLPGQWDRLSGPLRGLGLLLGVLIVLKLYGALLHTLGDLPLLPRLLQLVGLLALLRFSLTRLTRSSDRKVILDDWKRRWDTFSGS